MSQILKAAGWVGTGLVSGVLIAASVQSFASKPDTGAIPTAEIQQLASVFEYIKNAYVEPVDEKKLIQDAIAGMVGGLDAHSQYFSEKDWESFKESSSGSFVGIGIQIDTEDGLVRVVTPFEDGPAFKAGLRAGDLITRVNATPTRGLPLEDVVKLIRGEKGTSVRLTIFRKDENRTFGVSVVRDAIQTPSVKAKIVEPGYAWMRLSQFQERSLEDFVTKFNALMQEDPKLKGLVLDLRNDPGGLLNAAVGISAVFLPPNVTVVSTKGQLAESKAVYKTIPADYASYS
jgi:carboxyl-terminal processing protease